MMHGKSPLKVMSRCMRNLLGLFTDDRRALEKLALPIFRLGSVVPGSAGLFCEQFFLHWTKEKRSAAAVADFMDHLDRLGPDSICIDLGANVGEFTELMAKKAGEVHAFEPDPWAYERLHQRVGHISNVKLYNAAVGTSDGTITLFRADWIDKDPSLSLGSSVIPAQRGVPTSEVSVTCVDFARFVMSLARPVDVVKMDIEGAEVEILQNLLISPAKERVEKIFVETHYNAYPEQTLPIARLRREYACLNYPSVNFDWP